MSKRNKNNQASKPNADAFVTKIIAEFKDMQRAEIQKWRRNILTASDPENQRLYPLQDMFDNLKSDGHFIGDIRLRKAATLCTPFSIIDKKSGDVQEEKTKFFKRKWFYDFMSGALDYVPYGYTLLEMTDALKPTFKVIPRRNIIPRKQEILLRIQDSKGYSYAAYLGQTLIEIGEPEELGLMADLCGQLIWKRNAQQLWATYSEKFGLPLITATTNKSGDADIARIKKMLQVLGEAAQAVLPEGTTIDVKESRTGDAYLVFDKQIERANTELSKATLGGTMLTDNGSSRSQSEVHERNLDDKLSEDDRRIITFTVNDQLIPMLSLWGHDINPDTDEFMFDPGDEMDLKEFWDIIVQALGMYEIPDDWVSKKFGFPIAGRKVLQQTIPTAVSGNKGFSANFQ